MLIYVSPFVSISIVERIEIKESDHPQIAKNLSANGLASKVFVQSSFVTPTFASLSPSYINVSLLYNIFSLLFNDLTEVLF